MTVSDFNEVIKHCKSMGTINYIEPTIHVRSGWVTGITVYPNIPNEVKEFTVTNSPEGYDLKKEVMDYLDSIDTRK